MEHFWKVVEFLFGGGVQLMTWYLIMMGIDLITGYIKGLKNHNWNSAFNLQGLLKKFGAFSTVLVAAMIEDVAPTLGIHLPVPIALYWTGLLIAYEALSILENYKESGGKGFNFLAKYLDVMHKKAEDEEGEDKK